MKAFITVGVSGSGKTTWANARRNNFKNTMISCRDNLRWKLMESRNITPCWANWKWKDEGFITNQQNEDFIYAARQGYDLVVADLNLHPGRRAQLKSKLEQLGYEVSTVIFNDVTLEEALRRDAVRSHGVGAAVIHKQWEQFAEQYLERYTPDITKPTAVLVDIDGTLATMGDRSPFEWHKVHLDTVNEVVAQMVAGLSRYHQIIFLSGRDGVCEPATLQFIENAMTVVNAPSWKLFMRTPGDQRKDTIIKREIFDANIRDSYNVIAAVDDRPSVCRMWRDLGIPVIQIGNPYVEF